MAYSDYESTRNGIRSGAIVIIVVVVIAVIVKIALICWCCSRMNRRTAKRNAEAQQHMAMNNVESGAAPAYSPVAAPAPYTGLTHYGGNAPYRGPSGNTADTGLQGYGSYGREPVYRPGDAEQHSMHKPGGEIQQPLPIYTR